MTDVREHRGITYSIPPNDDGVWRFRIHPGHMRADKQRPPVAPPTGYSNRDVAIQAAECAIDDWLRRPAARE